MLSFFLKLATLLPSPIVFWVAGRVADLLDTIRQSSDSLPDSIKGLN